MTICFGLVLAVLAIVGVAGCSSQQDHFEPGQGMLSPGTASLTINDAEPVAVERVQCETTDYLTSIKIGSEPFVAMAMVSNAGELTTEWVRIHDLNGFRGSYGDGLGSGSAHVTFVGSTYHIAGSADGINADNPSSPKAERFEIKVAC